MTGFHRIGGPFFPPSIEPVEPAEPVGPVGPSEPIGPVEPAEPIDHGGVAPLLEAPVVGGNTVLPGHTDDGFFLPEDAPDAYEAYQRSGYESMIGQNIETVIPEDKTLLNEVVIVNHLSHLPTADHVKVYDTDGDGLPDMKVSEYMVEGYRESKTVSFYQNGDLSFEGDPEGTPTKKYSDRVRSSYNQGSDLGSNGLIKFESVDLLRRDGNLINMTTTASSEGIVRQRGITQKHQDQVALHQNLQDVDGDGTFDRHEFQLRNLASDKRIVMVGEYGEGEDKPTIDAIPLSTVSKEQPVVIEPVEPVMPEDPVVVEPEPVEPEPVLPGVPGLPWWFGG